MDRYVRDRADGRKLAFERIVAHLDAELGEYNGIAFYCSMVHWYMRSATWSRGDVEMFGDLRFWGGVLCVRLLWGACGLGPALRTHNS